MPQPDYLQLLDHLYDGLYFVDPQRKITFWNRTAEQITGYTAEEVIGSHCYDNILNHVDADGGAWATDLIGYERFQAGLAPL